LAAIAAWAARNFLFGRTEERLAKERDAARVEAEEAKIQAEGKTHEAAVLKNLQKKKAALDGLDGDALLDELNARNR
jgi:hypothetical protein